MWLCGPMRALFVHRLNNCKVRVERTHPFLVTIHFNSFHAHIRYAADSRAAKHVHHSDLDLVWHSSFKCLLVLFLNELLFAS